jgi:hypothetical protein
MAERFTKFPARIVVLPPAVISLLAQHYRVSDNHRADTERKWEITRQLRTKLMCNTES